MVMCKRYLKREGSGEDEQGTSKERVLEVLISLAI